MKKPQPATIALAGSISSGKSTAARILHEKLGFEVIRTREVLAKYIVAQGGVADDRSLQEHGGRIMSGPDAEAFCSALVEQITPNRSYVIDSLRPTSHYEFLRRALPALRLLFVFASPEERKRRYLSRIGGRDATEEGYNARTTHPVEEEVLSLMGFADAIAVDNGESQFARQILSAALPWLFPENPLYFQELFWAVEGFHRKHNYDVCTGNRDVMSLRIGLMVEELGELHACISKGKGDIDEEHADLLYLLLGNCVTLGLDLEKAFLLKHGVNMARPSRRVGGIDRVSDWKE